MTYDALPSRLDATLAAAVMAFAVGSILTGSVDEGPWLVTLPVAVLMTGTLAWRRRASLLAVVVGVGAMVAQSLLAEPAGSLWAFAVTLALTYSVAAERPEGPAAVGGATMLAGQFLTERLENGVDYVFIVIVFGGAWLVGRAVRQWQGRATHAEEHQHELALLAVAEERVRVARELHDVVAHSLSVIAVQADAAEAALDHDPALVGAPLRAIRASAREALTDMRQMLDLLRSEDDASLAPARSLAELPALVESVRATGALVDSRLPDPEAVPGSGLDPVVDLTGYRIVQEALTNAMRYAGPAVIDLLVELSTDRLQIEVGNALPPAERPHSVGAGRGLIGLGERVRAVGGSLSAGPVDGRFVVRADLPVQVRSGHPAVTP